MRSNVYSVTQVNSYIKNMFMQDYWLQSLQVRGEVSNCKYHSSGHIYFTLKDEKAAVACVMFAANRNGLKCEMREGMQVVVTGNADVYERDGKYQIYARSIVQDGIGNLFEQFEKRKAELKERGMFESEYKKKIPSYVRKLGVVTASTGAAVRDIIDVSKRRNPGVEIILAPATVQGDGAAKSIAGAIERLDQFGVDVIIVGRGGGSIEDLWAFNEEIVAEAVFNCNTPVISAVGHETDFTIIDFVADMRAPTPSAAAELAIYDVYAVKESINVRKNRLRHDIRRSLDKANSTLAGFEGRLRLLSPSNRLNEKRMRLAHLEERINQEMQNHILKSRHRLEMIAGTLHGVSPLNKLSGGYAYIEDCQKVAIRSVEQVKVEDELSVIFSDGRVRTKVTAVQAEDITNGK